MLVIHGDKDYRVPIGEGLRLWYELLAASALPGRRRRQQPAPVPVFPVRGSLGGRAAAHQDLVPGGDRLPGRARAGGERRIAGGTRSTVAPVTATREYDIVLYGATGFVGKLTAEYLARAGGNARIALAGRSTDRLLAVRETLGESAQSWPVSGGGRVVAVDAGRDGRPDPGRRHHRRALQPTTACRWSRRARPRAPITPT